MKQDSSLEFDMLLDLLTYGSSNRVDMAADVIQTLGRWLIVEGKIIEGNKAIDLAEDIESRLEEVEDLPEDIEDLRTRLMVVGLGFVIVGAEKTHKPLSLDEKVLQDTLAFWTAVHRKTPHVVTTLNSLSVMLDKDGDSKAASHARDLALWVNGVTQ